MGAVWLYVVGGDQKLHFRQIFESLGQLGADWAGRCIHVDFGLVRFGEGKMSTRQGNVILLDEVIEKAAGLALDIIDEKNPDLPMSAAYGFAMKSGVVTDEEYQDYRMRNFKHLAVTRKKEVTHAG